MYSGPHIKRDGLVFGFDTGANPSSNFDPKNKKRRFFKGKIASNVVTNTNLNTGWSKGYQTSILYDEIKPPKGVNSQVVGFNKSSSSSYWYSYGDYAPQTPGATYTVSMYVQTRDSNFRIRFYTANNSETGRVWGSYITVPNDGKWHRVVWPSFLNPSNSQSDSLSFNFTMASSGDSSRTWFCAPQMEVGTEASPFIDGTRSSTESLIDLTKTTNIDVSNVSFDSDGLPTFDGTDDRIDSVTGVGITDYFQPFTMECVFKVPTGGTWANNRNSNIFSIAGSYAGQYGIYKYGTDGIGFQIRDASTGSYPSSTGYAKGIYHHVVATFNGGSGMNLYINGSWKSSSSTTFTGAPDTTNLYIGGVRSFGGSAGTWFYGEIPVAKYYNKALTAQEVKQNFKAYKNRFGI